MTREIRTNNNEAPMLTEIKQGAANFSVGKFDYDTLIFMSKVSRAWGTKEEFMKNFAAEGARESRFVNEVILPETVGVMVEIESMDRVHRAACLYMSYAAERNIDQALMNADSARLYCDTAELFDKLGESTDQGDEVMAMATRYDDQFYTECTSFAFHYSAVLGMVRADIDAFETILPTKGTSTWKWAAKIEGKI